MFPSTLQWDGKTDDSIVAFRPRLSPGPAATLSQFSDPPLVPREVTLGTYLSTYHGPIGGLSLPPRFSSFSGAGVHTGSTEVLNISKRRWSVHIPSLGIFSKIDNILKKTYILNHYHVLNLRLSPSCLRSLLSPLFLAVLVQCNPVHPE